jgi:hypothetical protein
LAEAIYNTNISFSGFDYGYKLNLFALAESVGFADLISPF